MIRGIFVERGLPARWKNVAYTFGELMKLVGDRLYIKHIFKSRIVIISNRQGTKSFICQYKPLRFTSLPVEALKSL